MRSYEKEILDEGTYTLEEYEECLSILGKIGRSFGGDRASLSAFKKTSPNSILDVGCGGGDFCALLARRYPETQVRGIDLSEEAIAYAQKNHQAPNLSFERSPSLLPADVITCTLVCHHMDDEELISFLKEARAQARQRVIINDLHRHPLTSLSFAFIAPWLYRNRLITHDGLLSIRRAFTRSDWKRYVAAAGIPKENCRISWHLGFRWIVEIDGTNCDHRRGPCGPQRS